MFNEAYNSGEALGRVKYCRQVEVQRNYREEMALGISIRGLEQKVWHGLSTDA